MPLSTVDREQATMRVRATWKSAHNSWATMATDFFRLRSDYAKDAYGSPSFGAWLMKHCGLNEDQIIRMLDIFKRGIAEEEQEAVRLEVAQKSKAKRQAKLQAAEEALALRTAQTALKQHQQDDAEAQQIERAKRAAEAVRAADKAQTIEGRRAINLEYGRALLALRGPKENRNDNRFHKLVADHKLEVHTQQWRTDAMWLAENWSTGHRISGDPGPYSNPQDIRKWVHKEHPEVYQAIEAGKPVKPGKSAGGPKPKKPATTKKKRETPVFDKAFSIVKPLVDAAATVDVAALTKEHGIPRHVFHTAVFAKRESDKAVAIDRTQRTVIGPLSGDDYMKLSTALHEDLTTPELRAVALDVLVSKKAILLGEVRPPIPLRVVGGTDGS